MGEHRILGGWRRKGEKEKAENRARAARRSSQPEGRGGERPKGPAPPQPRGGLSKAGRGVQGAGRGAQPGRLQNFTEPGRAAPGRAGPGGRGGGRRDSRGRGRRGEGRGQRRGRRGSDGAGQRERRPRHVAAGAAVPAAEQRRR